LLSPELFFEDFTEIEALTSLWITTIISINPIITRNTMLSDINDIISAPEGPEKWALNEITSDILMTSKLTYIPKGRYPALDLADEHISRYLTRQLGILGKPCVSDRDGMTMHNI
jgi:hypothetical protein